ncbi:hypothetical protein E4T21_21510 [Halomonas binhaiensis]|uniref:Uncharacterized protein n=1 Tax=Halomonas binhaiensis TaxID=2562282 RepID=A0A7U3HWQ1_9GAMM|nr:hypothetical protein [Halomonas binhaiensis]QRG26812.1 hypothetical protein E4T21_21510 [Halomonas binhaiensis]
MSAGLSLYGGFSSYKEFFESAYMNAVNEYQGNRRYWVSDSLLQVCFTDAMLEHVDIVEWGDIASDFFRDKEKPTKEVGFVMLDV